MIAALMRRSIWRRDRMIPAAAGAGLHVGSSCGPRAGSQREDRRGVWGHSRGRDGCDCHPFWSDLEPSAGVYDMALLESHLAITDLFDMHILFTIRTIDTVKVNGPVDS
jgi:hypothetical protein